MIRALGFKYAILLPVSALVVFVLTLIVVVRGKGPMATAALLLIVPVPFLIGVFAAIEGGLRSFRVMATLDTDPPLGIVAAAVSTVLVAPMVGMSLMVPSHILAIVGSLVRSFSADPKVSSEGRE
jgi:hypothetical protein